MIILFILLLFMGILGGLVIWIIVKFDYNIKLSLPKHPQHIKKERLTTKNKNFYLNGPNIFSAKVVGVSHYQENLKKICVAYSEEGVDKNIVAKLIHDDLNPYDSNAITVEIDGYTVGHLSRNAAVYFRNKMTEYGHKGQTAICKAKIKGGWERDYNDIGNYGIVLDLPHNLIEGFEVETINEVDYNNMEHNIIIFYVYKAITEELIECNIGEYVNFWTPKDELLKVYIYRRGSVGGTGKIGYVPSEYARIISNQLKEKLEYETEILEINIEKRLCKIKCKIFSREETIAKRSLLIVKERERLRTELQKYINKPKDSFKIDIYFPKNYKLKEGDILFLKRKSLKQYLNRKNPSSISASFTDNTGKVVAKTVGQPSVVRRILRAYFSGYKISIRILSIDSYPGNEIRTTALVKYDTMN